MSVAFALGFVVAFVVVVGRWLAQDTMYRRRLARRIEHAEQTIRHSKY